MAGNVLIADNYCTTNVKMINTTFMWTINNFSFCNVSIGQSLCSPIFSPLEDKLVAWRIHMYPYGLSDPNLIPIYLCSNSRHQQKIVAECRFSIINSKGEMAYQVGYSPKSIFNYGASWGFPNFIQRTKLFNDAINFLPNDSLTIYCEIKASIGYENLMIKKNISNKPVYNHELQISLDFKWLYETGSYSDITLVINGQEFLAHKSILAARSPVFETMFYKHAEKDNNLHLVKIDDVETNVMHEVLRYVYIGKAENLNLLGNKILSAAIKYKITGLQRLCEDYIIRCLNTTNAIQLLVTAHFYKVEKLKAEIIKFIISNADKIIGTPEYESIKASDPLLFIELCDQTTKNLNATEITRKNRKRKNCEDYYFNYKFYDGYIYPF